jgi:hypothetical protein
VENVHPKLAKALKKGIPLNKRMRKLLAQAQKASDSADMSNWLAENDAWGME